MRAQDQNYLSGAKAKVYSKCRAHCSTMPDAELGAGTGL